MRFFVEAALLLAAFSFSCPVFAEELPLLPDPSLTPGAVRSTNVKEICTPGYSRSMRKTTDKMKNAVYEKYGIMRDSERVKIDHLIPLSIGGADTEENLWPSPLFPGPVNGRDKDRLEFRLYRMVCHEGYDVRAAQRDIRKNWLAAYEKYCSSPESCPSFVDYMAAKELSREVGGKDKSGRDNALALGKRKTGIEKIWDRLSSDLARLFRERKEGE